MRLKEYYASNMLLKLKQIQSDIYTWKHLLGFMMHENVILKNKLPEILKDKFDKDLIDEVENFQNMFIKEDEVIGVLRNDIAELDKLLGEEIFEDEKIIQGIDIKLKKLSNDIIHAKGQFRKLKLEFNDYLYDYLSKNLQNW